MEKQKREQVATNLRGIITELDNQTKADDLGILREQVSRLAKEVAKIVPTLVEPFE